MISMCNKNTENRLAMKLKKKCEKVKGKKDQVSTGWMEEALLHLNGQMETQGIIRKT
jgi:hypothetical protein